MATKCPSLAALVLPAVVVPLLLLLPRCLLALRLRLHSERLLDQQLHGRRPGSRAGRGRGAREAGEEGHE